MATRGGVGCSDQEFYLPLSLELESVREIKKKKYCNYTSRRKTEAKECDEIYTINIRKPAGEAKLATERKEATPAVTSTSTRRTTFVSE